MKKRKWIHTARDIHNTKRVLPIAKTAQRIIVIYADRYNGNSGDSKAYFVKNGRIYNPDFDCDYRLEFWCKRKKFPPEHEATLEELIEQGYNLKLAGYPGDGKKAYWNNHANNRINLLVQMRLLERW